MKSVLILIDSLVSIYIWILIINALLSWLIAFNVLNTSNRLVYSLLDISYKMTDPLLRPIRNFLPNLGGIDISPVILILLLMFIRNLAFEFFVISMLFFCCCIFHVSHKDLTLLVKSERILLLLLPAVLECLL